MTVEKAVEILKTNNEKRVAAIYASCKRLAIEALEKQIPKKTTKIQRVPNGWLTYGHCPNCDSFTRNTLKYCGNCGQALDWSETE